MPMSERAALVPRGTPIAVVAPCGAYDPARFERGLALGRAAGHDLRPLPGLLQPHRYLAGTDDHRLAQLTEALTNPEYGAVWAARGGYGLTRILDRIDFDRIPRKPVLGFSDVTALHTALVQRGLGPAIHAPMVHSFPKTSDASLNHLWSLLAGEHVPPLQGRTLVPGSVEGPLVGGNLCLLAATCGTADQLDARGAILVLEEIGEPAYRVDRMLQQLASAGVLRGVAGIALGEFVHCRVPEGVDWTLLDMIREHVEPLDVPVVVDLPIGHGQRNHAFVYGAPARLGDGALALF